MDLFDVLFAKKLSGGGSPFPPVIKRVTGNPIEISDGADAPLVKCVTEIQGYQEGTGTPSPENVRPIVAYSTGAIEVRGKNLFDMSKTVAATFTTDIATTLSNFIANDEYAQGYISSKTTISNNANYRSVFIKFEPNTTYTASGEMSSAIILDSEGNIIERSASWVDLYTYTAGNSLCYLIAGLSNQSLPTFQVEKGSTATTYEPYTSTTHTTTFPSAIYRGSEDVVKGEVTSEWVKTVFSGSSSEAWDYNSANQAFFCVNGLTTPYVDNSRNDFALCNMAEQLRYNAVSGSEIVDGKFCIGMSGANNILYFKNTNFTSVSDFKTWLSTNNLEVAYKLAIPTTSSVTPTNLPIKSLAGYSHIESSTGEMVVDYITDAYQNFVDTVESAFPNTRLLNASKGGVKAFDIFKTLDEPKGPEASAEESEPEEKETEEDAKR